MKQSTIQTVLGLICLAASLWLSYRQGVAAERRRWQQTNCIQLQTSGRFCLYPQVN